MGAISIWPEAPRARAAEPQLSRSLARRIAPESRRLAGWPDREPGAARPPPTVRGQAIGSAALNQVETGRVVSDSSYCLAELSCRPPALSATGTEPECRWRTVTAIGPLMPPACHAAIGPYGRTPCGRGSPSRNFRLYVTGPV